MNSRMGITKDLDATTNAVATASWSASGNLGMAIAGTVPWL